MNNMFHSMAGMSQMLQQLKSNPMQFLLQRKLNVPQEIANDPQAILNHLLASGQVSQEQVNMAYQRGRMFR